MKLTEYTHRLYQQKDKLFRFARKIIGQSEEAEDVVQEVFAKMWANRSERYQLQNLEAFCMTITRNMALDRLRRKQRFMMEIPENSQKLASSQRPDKTIEQKDAARLVSEFMENLPLKQKMALQLRDVEGMAYKEIANILEIPLNQVKVNLFRARQKIRQELIKMHDYGLQ